MFVSLLWLNDFLNLENYSADDIADKMSRTGIEIEGIQNYGANLTHLVVGHVESCVAHPNSDHLHVCQVNVGEANGGIRQIVCGAPNVSTGANVIVALPGCTLPGGMTIQKGELRGEVSDGMLCALQELGFSDSVVPKKYAEGLFLLPEDAPIGESVVAYLTLDDPILELSITPNRADALSMRGVAYEVGAIVSQKPELILNEARFLSQDTILLDAVSVTIQDDDTSNGYQARVIKNVTIKDSPLWLQMRLMKSGIRPINNVVDITNYILIQYGQPLHAFDYDKLPSHDMIVRYANDNEPFTTLDGQSRVLTHEDVVIAAGDVPVALAGVMGGLDSEVTESTRTVLLESAVFNPINVRQTSKRFNLRSESSARFEKGINYATIQEAGEQAAILIAELGQGEVVDGTVWAGLEKVKPVHITVHYDAIPNKLGIELKTSEIGTIFERLGFGVSFGPETFTVSVPPRRWDIAIEADILEEVARIYGYDNLPNTLPVVPSTPGSLTSRQRLMRQTRAIMEGFGLNETISYVLTSPKQAELMKSTDYPLVRLDFPMSEDRSVLRQSMFPALLEIAKYNQARHNRHLAFYEMGKVFYGKGQNVQPKEEERLAIFVSGQVLNKTWYGNAKSFDFFDLKGILDAYFEAIRILDRIRYERISTVEEMHPGRTAQIVLDDQIVGIVGQIHPTLAEEYDLNDSTFFVELNFDHIIAITRADLVQKPIAKFPASSRDLALLVPSSVSSQLLYDTIRQHGGAHLVSIELFDLYEGAAALNGKVSLAYRLTFQHPDRTLTDDDVQSVMQDVTSALHQVDGLEIR